METQTDDRQKGNGQLIFVPHKDTIRLLEVYVQRSLSLNDGTPGHKRARMKEKWVTMPRRQRRHSSDPLLHLPKECDSNGIDSHVAEPPAKQPETFPEEPQKPPKKSKKSKKPSFWKSLVSFFSKKSKDEKGEEEDGPAEIPEASQAEKTSDTTTTCLPTRKTSITRRLSRRLSFTRLNRSGKDLNAADITHVEDVISVEPTYSYYEKMSEELEKIVHEVQEKEEAKPLSDEEIINRIIALIKEEGDAIDNKLKDNPTLSSFFQRMSYLSFQKLADAYVETEASPIHNPPTVFPTAPELIKLAFTYDFTAKIAGLARQNIGYITSLGSRYLQDRFEYNQVCADHPESDSDS